MAAKLGPSEGGKVSRVQPKAADCDLTGTKARRCGRCLGFRADATHPTWRRFNLPAPSGTHSADCGERTFNPYSL